MNTVLLVLGALGFGAVVISAYVFTVAARKYVSDDADDAKGEESISPDSLSPKYILREQKDRRQVPATSFPITVNGITIASDRRKLPDRRLVA